MEQEEEVTAGEREKRDRDSERDTQKERALPTNLDLISICTVAAWISQEDEIAGLRETGGVKKRQRRREKDKHTHTERESITYGFRFDNPLHSGSMDVPEQEDEVTGVGRLQRRGKPSDRKLWITFET